MDVPELMDYVIDFLHDDPRSLRACSVVRRAWSTSARFHLFETISITRSDQLKNLQDSTVPFRFSSVQRMLLVGTRAVGNTLEILEAPYWRRFSHLTRLCITHIGVTSLDEEEKLHDFFLNFPLLRVLTIGYCDFTSPRAIVKVMQSMPCLFALEIYGTIWSPLDLGGPPAQGSLPFAIRHLRLSGGLRPYVFVRCLIAACPVLDIRSLSLGENGVDYNDFTAILTRCSKTLKMINLLEPSESIVSECTVFQTKDRIGTRCVEDLDMSQFTNLETIILPSYNPQRGNLPAHILRTTTSEHVRQICILFSLEGNTTLRTVYHVGYGEIDDQLATPRFQNAMVFVGVIPGWGNRNEDKAEVVAKASSALVRMLPKCSARNVLAVEHFHAVVSRFDIGSAVTRYADRPLSSWVS